MQEEAPTIGLTERERDLVREQRARLHGPLRNGEFPHTVLRPRDDGEVDIIYVVSKRMRFSRQVYHIAVQAIGLTSSDANRVAFRNVRFYPRSGYHVDSWDEPENGPSWGWDVANSRGVGDIPGPVANPEALASTRYRYAALDERCWNIRPAVYLRALREHPEAELLHKADLDQLITPAILKHGGRELARFIMRSAEDIRELEAGPAAVLYAFRHKVTIKRGVARVTARAAMRGVPLPDGLTPEDALVYCSKARIRVWEFERHARHCQMLQLGASAWTPAPRRFHAFAEEVEATIAKKDEAERRRQALKRAKKFKAAQASLASLSVKVPKTVVVIVPVSLKELESEGHKMRNCIGNGMYGDSVAEGKSLVAFLRESSDHKTPWCDVEFRREKKTWKVAQCYARFNKPAPDNAWKAARAICTAMNRKKGA